MNYHKQWDYRATIWGLNSPNFPMCPILRMEQTEQVEHVNNELVVVSVFTYFCAQNVVVMCIICCKLIRYVFLRRVPLFVKRNRMERQKIESSLQLSVVFQDFKFWSSFGVIITPQLRRLSLKIPTCRYC